MTFSRSASSSVLLLALLAALLLPGAPSSAHSYLLSSDPSDGAVLTESPELITMKFSDGILAEGSGITVTGPTGQSETGRIVVTGKQALSNWPFPGEPGKFSVDYRIVSSDGHVMSGQFSFKVKKSAQAAPTPTASSAPTTPPAAAADSTLPPNGSSAPPLWLWGLLAALIAVGIGLVRAARRNHD